VASNLRGFWTKGPGKPYSRSGKMGGRNPHKLKCRRNGGKCPIEIRSKKRPKAMGKREGIFAKINDSVEKTTDNDCTW